MFLRPFFILNRMKDPPLLLVSDRGAYNTSSLTTKKMNVHIII
jgi:hypothetical protein